MKRLLTVACFFSVLFAARSVFALDMEYYTYGGFAEITNAFQKIALIFSDNGFKAAVFIAMVGGIMLGSVALVMRAVGGRISAFSWGVPIMAGYIVYLAMIVPQGNIWVYDPVANRNQQIGGVPDGIVLIAGTMNKIERFVVDAIYVAGDPKSFQSNAGGRAFNLMYDLAQAGGLPVDGNTAASLKKYTDDCVLFELQRPGTTLTVDALAASTDFFPEYAKAASPSIYTVTYILPNYDQTMSCEAAWTVLSGALANAPLYSTALKQACASAGYNIANAAEFQQCTDVFEAVINDLTAGAYAATDVTKQMLMGQTINDVLLGNSPSLAMTVLTNRNTGSSMIGAGIAANQWLPTFKAAMTAIAICLIPFLVIFLPTPLAKKALFLICGTFIYITVWGVVDAICHSMATDYAYKILSDILQTKQLGMITLNFFSTGPAKALAVMGAMRWGGMAVAGATTAVLVGGGGAVIGSMAGQAFGTAQHTGSASGTTVGTPEGLARQLGQTEMAPVTIANASKYSYASRVDSGMAQKFGATESGIEMMEGFGGVNGAASMYRKMSTGKAIRFGSNAYEEYGLTNSTNALQWMSAAQLNEMAETRDAFHGDVGEYAKTRVAPQQAFNQEAEARGMKPYELAGAIATRDVAANADTLRKFMERTGETDYLRAARSLGELAASERTVGTMSYQNARGVVGEDGLIGTKTNEALNEAAKFAMLSRVAQGLGIAKDENDFRGMYEQHKLHHGEDGMTLNGAAAERLNAQIGDHYKTRFQEGDRVKINFGEDGRVISAFATRGASRDTVDITNSLKGRHSQLFNLKESQTGTRSSDGTLRDHYNLDKTQTGKRVEQGSSSTTYTNFNRNIGEGEGVVGRDEKGNAVMGPVFTEKYTDGKGHVLAERTTNKNTGEFTGKVWVADARLGKDGKYHGEYQTVTGTAQNDAQGQPQLWSFSSFGNEETERGTDRSRFATTSKVDSHRQTIRSNSERGNSVVEHWNSYNLHQENQAHTSFFAGFQGGDPVFYGDGSKFLVQQGANLDYAVDFAGKGLSFSGNASKAGMSARPAKPAAPKARVKAP